MSVIHLTYEVSGDDFTRAGEASGMVKSKLKKLGYNKDAIRRVAIAMYEAEINMVIHADGGVVDVDIYPDKVEVVLADKGPGIPDVEKAMQEGYSTAPDNVRNLGFGAGMGLPNIKKYTDAIFAQDNLIDTLILGCTHYPIVADKIKRHLPGGVRLVQQGEHVAESLADYLKRHPDMDSKCTKNGRTQFFTTENEEKFAESASVFLKTEINVKGIELE